MPNKNANTTQIEDISFAQKHERAQDTLKLLYPIYPERLPALLFHSPFELLVATILSAQCTDARVNMVTPELFSRWPTPQALATALREDIEAVIHSTGFFRAKSKNLQGMAQILVEKFNSIVPNNMHELVTLPGVGRKTAGVVLSACYDRQAIIVDTHFGRVARRLGFAKSEDPVKLESEIASFLPESEWTDFSMLLNIHGRRRCHSRKPDCTNCELTELCPSSIR